LVPGGEQAREYHRAPTLRNAERRPSEAGIIKCEFSVSANATTESVELIDGQAELAAA